MTIEQLNLFPPCDLSMDNESGKKLLDRLISGPKAEPFGPNRLFPQIQLLNSGTIIKFTDWNHRTEGYWLDHVLWSLGGLDIDPVHVNLYLISYKDETNEDTGISEYLIFETTKINP